MYAHATSVVVDSLFIVAPIVCLGSVFGPCFVMQYFDSVLSSFAIILAGCFTLIVFLISFDCKCAVGLWAVCDCGIS